METFPHVTTIESFVEGIGEVFDTFYQTATEDGYTTWSVITTLEKEKIKEHRDFWLKNWAAIIPFLEGAKQQEQS